MVLLLGGTEIGAGENNCNINNFIKHIFKKI